MSLTEVNKHHNFSKDGQFLSKNLAIKRENEPLSSAELEDEMDERKKKVEPPSAVIDAMNSFNRLMDQVISKMKDGVQEVGNYFFSQEGKDKNKNNATNSKVENDNQRKQEDNFPKSEEVREDGDITTIENATPKNESNRL